MKPSLPTPTHIVPETELIDALSQSAFVTMGALTKLAGAADLSLTQLRVLAILRDRRLRMTDLVDYLGLEKSTLTGLVSRAEAKGLLMRTSDPVDRRAVDVHLTDEGHRLAEQLSVELANRMQPLVAPLTSDEQSTLSDLLVKTLGI